MNLLVVKDESKEKIFSVRDVINIVNCLPIDDLLDDAFGNGKDDLIEIDDVSFSLDEKEIVFDDVDWSFKHNAISDIYPKRWRIKLDLFKKIVISQKTQMQIIAYVMLVVNFILINKNLIISHQ